MKSFIRNFTALIFNAILMSLVAEKNQQKKHKKYDKASYGRYDYTNL
jgi:hypothetical protein